MRTAVFQILMLAMTLGSLKSWAGGEVPWPVENEQDVYLRELSGVWMSQTIENPQVIYYFNIERALVVVDCQLTLRLYEIDPKHGTMIAAGNTPYCVDNKREINFMMYDNFGRARNWVSIVGLSKPADSTTPGLQYLGLTQFKVATTWNADDSVSEDKILQDIFYKVSN